MLWLPWQWCGDDELACYRTGLLVSGQTNSQSAFSEGGMTPFPLYHKKPWFLPAVGAYYQLRDWVDRQ